MRNDDTHVFMPVFVFLHHVGYKSNIFFLLIFSVSYFFFPTDVGNKIEPHNVDGMDMTYMAVSDVIRILTFAITKWSIPGKFEILLTVFFFCYLI